MHLLHVHYILAFGELEYISKVLLGNDNLCAAIMDLCTLLMYD